AGVVAKYAFERIARIPVDVDIASEFRYRSPLFDPSDIFIIISQSGETADTLAAMRMARSSGARVIAITNVVGSTLAREADLVMYTWAGPEIAVASTKAFTTQLMCVYLIAIRLAALRGALADADAARLVGELSRLPDSARAILDRQAEIQRFASQSFNKSKAFFMGRLFDYAISLESALKLKEISYTHSEAFAAGELKHGPIALVDDSTLVVAICTQRELFDKMDSNIKEVKARGATVLVVTFDGESYFDATADAVFRVPEAPGELTPILSVIPCQLYAYYCAIQRGLDPDKPRNLAKSVTVE
ncbi:MAG TPA: isomerizing glutamine--fructose-6-phosphate transaminase, partial [Treponemataceae bacterium]|nr:isomerizing glutamine--fructose-6-phosphate transaminase [Treponemataceae bacterium]